MSEWSSDGRRSVVAVERKAHEDRLDDWIGHPTAVQTTRQRGPDGDGEERRGERQQQVAVVDQHQICLPVSQ